MASIPIAPIKRALKKDGGRVSEEAAIALAKYVEYVIDEISDEAWQYAQVAHRKTIKAVDVELALKL